MSRVNLVEILKGAVYHIRAGVPQHVRVEETVGQYDVSDIKREFNRAPAILTAMMTARKSNSENDDVVQFVSWVLARATNADKLASNGLALVSLLMPRLTEFAPDWSVDGVRDKESRNLYGYTLGSINVSLWAVTWSIPLRASTWSLEEGGILLPTELEPFLGYDAIHEVGETTIDDTIDLVTGV